jgi:hypothetical protein
LGSRYVERLRGVNLQRFYQMLCGNKRLIDRMYLIRACNMDKVSVMGEQPAPRCSKWTVD